MSWTDGLHQNRITGRKLNFIMAGMGVPRLVISKILNHVESGVTRVYDRHSYDKEKQEALDAWGARLVRIVSDLELVEKQTGEA